MRHLDTDALAAFVAVIDHGGFTAAGEHIGKTQAAVSLMISRLEDRLGKRLVERSRRGVSLTRAGELLIGYARRIRELEDEALFALGESEATRIRVGMPDDYLESIGSLLLRDYPLRQADAQVEVICDFSYRLEQMLQDGTLDMAIISREKDRPIGVLLKREALLWCTHPDRRPELLSPLPLVLFPEGCRARPKAIAALDRAGCQWRIVCTSSHIQGVQAAIRMGEALTVLPATAVPADWRILGPEEGLPALASQELALVMPSGARLAVRRLAHFIEQQFDADSCQAAIA
ncbi:MULTISPECIES: LysR substrate-binding domain-containing protein [Phytopseudomonas]|uniref:LysR family transcriptional regulator n=1 Tax=Phytopseudomonas dryadis TaxID=2487520 RepID=A0A4Q9QV31_9GAMM|nr:MULTISPECIES: LysR substrate-binding domain-containing protein [Pseudomonas]TBU71336.1 LysR family transcriptional regulator [Pseudomonas daroniae]TBU87534.1 LysR family transcriptional regulator [Pseudomonas dryadis]